MDAFLKEKNGVLMEHSLTIQQNWSFTFRGFGSETRSPLEINVFFCFSMI